MQPIGPDIAHRRQYSPDAGRVLLQAAIDPRGAGPFGRDGWGLGAVAAIYPTSIHKGAATFIEKIAVPPIIMLAKR